MDFLANSIILVNLNECFHARQNVFYSINIECLICLVGLRTYKFFKPFISWGPKLLERKYPNMVSWHFIRRLYTVSLFQSILYSYWVVFGCCLFDSLMNQWFFFFRSTKCLPLFFCAFSFLLCIPVIIFVHVAYTSLHSHWVRWHCVHGMWRNRVTSQEIHL